MPRKQTKVTLTLQEFWAFSQSLSEDWYFEGDEEYVNDEFWEGPGHFDPTEKITVERDYITICYQGNDPESNGDFMEFIDEFTKWKTGIDYEYVTFEVSKSKAQAVRKIVEKYLKENGD
jgi:hypothetical protein